MPSPCCGASAGVAGETTAPPRWPGLVVVGAARGSGGDPVGLDAYDQPPQRSCRSSCCGCRRGRLGSPGGIGRAAGRGADPRSASGEPTGAGGPALGDAARRAHSGVGGELTWGRVRQLVAGRASRRPSSARCAPGCAVLGVLACCVIGGLAPARRRRGERGCRFHAPRSTGSRAATSSDAHPAQLYPTSSPRSRITVTNNSALDGAHLDGSLRRTGGGSPAFLLRLRRSARRRPGRSASLTFPISLSGVGSQATGPRGRQHHPARTERRRDRVTSARDQRARLAALDLRALRVGRAHSHGVVARIATARHGAPHASPESVVAGHPLPHSRIRGRAWS